MLRGKDLEQEVRKFIRETLDSAKKKTSQLKPKKSLPIRVIMLTLTLILLTGVITYHYQKITEAKNDEKVIDSAFKPVTEIVKEKQRNTPLFGCSQIIQKKFDDANEGGAVKKTEP